MLINRIQPFITHTDGDPVGGDNATIRQMREALEAANTRTREAELAKAAAEEKATALERQKLDEMERLKLEKGDLEKKVAEGEKIRDEHGKYASTFESLYKQALSEVPAEHASRVERLTGNGTWAERFQLLQEAKALIPTTPTTAGTSTNPGIPNPAAPAQEPKKQIDPKNWGSISLADAAGATIQ